MKLHDPLTFQSIFMERPWGGRRLETDLKFSLPPSIPIGELWALVDRPEAQSIVGDGAFQGKSLHELWTQHRAEIFGTIHLANKAPSFPLLCKILDAEESLSLQVHPKKAGVSSLKEEPKTECWYFLDAKPGAFCYAGLKHGVTRETFSNALQTGQVETLLHSLPVKSGTSLFLPSGRLHALGKGCLVVEIQQNSDTTYRVFDWNRRNSQNQPRTLHIDQAMASIDFSDYEPKLQTKETTVVADSTYFHVEKWILETPCFFSALNDFAIFTCLTGSVSCHDRVYNPGDFFLVPANKKMLLVPLQQETTLLCTQLPPCS